MKLLICSDIHGDLDSCERMLAAFEREGADKIVLLGDILYHGPRNDLPKDYAPKEVIAMLNPLKDKIFCVRGNCDTEVDQMVLDFPVLADYAVIAVDNKLIYATHGHNYNEEKLPPLSDGDILFCGHTHVPKINRHETYTYMNTGSVSIPKENSPHSYVVYENGNLLWKDLETGGIYLQSDFK